MALDTENGPEGQTEYITFRIGEEEYCIEITLVREIRRWTNATRLPHAPEYLKGVVNLRGAVVPVVDFSARLGGQRRKRPHDTPSLSSKAAVRPLAFWSTPCLTFLPLERNICSQRRRSRHAKYTKSYPD